jgi:hypothetical protein
MQGLQVSRKFVLLAVALLAGLAVTTGVAAPNVGDDDTPLSGSTLDQASAAALKHTGEGKVVDSEVGDDGAAYGIEIQLADGRQVEVNLDGSFNVTGQENDDDSGDEAGDD